MTRRGLRPPRRHPSRLSLALGLCAAAVLLGSSLPQPVSAATQPADTSCPTYNAPNALTLTGGTPQSAKLGAPFAEPLQVTLTNTNGCPITTPLAGIAVTFAAPGSGPSGTFAASGSNAVLVGTSSTGSATASQFTANTLTGGYQVVASSDYGSVDFSLVNTASGVPATIVPLSSASQSASVSTRYGQPLQAQVLDANGSPITGANVTFSLGSGSAGGSGAGGAGASFDGGQSEASALTDSSGIATSPRFTANSVAGKFIAAATTVGISDAASFQLHNLAGKPPLLEPVGKHKLSATAGTRYGRPLQVKLTDATGAPLEGTSVTFSLGSGSGGASGSGSGAASPGASFPGGSTQATEATNASGIATSPRFDANATAGTFTATAAVAGVTNPAEFTLDNLAGNPPTLKTLGPAKRSASVESRYSLPLEVKLTDRKGKPLQGESVTFVLTSSGGGTAGAGASFVGGSAQATETTNASGLAISPRFEANATAGTFTATATVGGSNAAASFQLAHRAGCAPTVKAFGTLRLQANVDSRYSRPLKVTVIDGRGRPLQGQPVTFTLGATGSSAGGTGSPSAGASFPGGSMQATATTNASGIATSPRFEANATAGTFTAVAAVSASTAVASIQLDNLAGAPSTVAAGAAATESTSVGSRFPIPLAVTVTDEHDNPVAGVLVTFRAPAGGASGGFAHARHRRSHVVRVRTNASGIAVAPAFTANGTPGGYIVKATVRGVAPVAFALVNQSPGL